jgi:hypothetical protein
MTVPSEVGQAYIVYAVENNYPAENEDLLILTSDPALDGAGELNLDRDNNYYF